MLVSDALEDQSPVFVLFCHSPSARSLSALFPCFFRFFRTPLMGNALLVSSPSALAGNLPLPFGAHHGKPSF